MDILYRCDSNKWKMCIRDRNKSADVIGKLSKETFDQIVEGRETFHRAFMTGAMTARGNLKTLRMLDEIFNFQK